MKIEGIPGESGHPGSSFKINYTPPPPPPPPFDLGIRTARAVPQENGDVQIHALVELDLLGEIPTAGTAEIEFVEVAGDDREVLLDIQTIDIRPTNGAITCAGECPSIFGDGVCTGCGCNYNNWLSTTVPGETAAAVDYFIRIKGIDGESDGDTSNDEYRLTVAPSTKPNPPWNRHLIGVQRDHLGLLDIQVGLDLADTYEEALDLSFEIEVHEEGQLTLTIPVEVNKNEAIWCAVQCAGSCPSIFGDGICTGCGCNYSNSFQAQTDPSVDDQDIVIILRPTAGALPELPGFGDDEEGRPEERPEECRQDPASSAMVKCFRRGDSSASGVVDFTDSLWTLEFLFLGTKEIGCMDAADFNDTGEVDLNDAIDGLKHAFLGAAPPAAPGAENGGGEYRLREVLAHSQHRKTSSR